MAESAVGRAPRVGRTLALPSQGGSRLGASRLGIAAISTAACTIGMLPSIIYLDRGLLLAGAVALVALIAIVSAFQIQPTHVHQPRPLEFVAAGLSAISQGALVSIIALVSYISVRALHWVVRNLLGLIGLSLPFGWSTPATIAGVAMGLLGVLGIVAPTVKRLWQALYPPIAGFPTPFRDFARSPLGAAVLTTGVIAAAVFTVFAIEWPLSRLGFWPCLLIAYLLAAATMAAWQTSQKKAAPRTFSTSAEAIGAMLQAMGYFVVPQPRTGLPEIDPYLAELDFAITREDRVYSMLIREWETSERSDIECVTQVLIATRALARGARKLGGELPPVQPVLVLVGVNRGDDVSTFELSKRVVIIRIPQAESLQTPSRDEQVLRLRGEEIFGALAQIEPPAQEAAPPVASSTSASGVAS